MEITINHIQKAVEYIQSRSSLVPEIGIILGTGLHSLAEEVEVSEEIDYKDIPGFPIATVEFHKGKLIIGHIGKRPVVVMQGRFHYYEGYSMQQVTMPVRVMKLLGIKQLMISNAAGGLNPEHRVSDLMMITDHINLLPENPLRGKNIDELGGRFPDMSEVYDPAMMEMARKIAEEEGIALKEGVYVSVTGPNLETPAEYKFLRLIGADAVGMSTVPEVIVARHMELPVFALSIITDLGIPGFIHKVDIQKIIEAARQAEPAMRQLMRRMTETVVY